MFNYFTDDYESLQGLCDTEEFYVEALNEYGQMNTYGPFMTDAGATAFCYDRAFSAARVISM